jgi:predicted Zn-dependent peptidase
MIMIKTGIEISNYEKTLAIIEEQLENIKNGEITEQELESARQLITSTSKLIPESGENLVTYYYDKEMNDEEPDLEKFINNIQKVKIEDIVDVAKDVSVDTIYFLRD